MGSRRGVFGQKRRIKALRAGLHRFASRGRGLAGPDSRGAGAGDRRPAASLSVREVPHAFLGTSSGRAWATALERPATSWVSASVITAKPRLRALTDVRGPIVIAC